MGHQPSANQQRGHRSHLASPTTELQAAGLLDNCCPRLSGIGKSGAKTFLAQQLPSAINRSYLTIRPSVISCRTVIAVVPISIYQIDTFAAQYASGPPGSPASINHIFSPNIACVDTQTVIINSITLLKVT